jgi:hypothetical protein
MKIFMCADILHGTLDGIVQQIRTDPWKSKAKERYYPMVERRGSKK